MELPSYLVIDLETGLVTRMQRILEEFQRLLEGLLALLVHRPTRLILLLIRLTYSVRSERVLFEVGFHEV